MLSINCGFVDYIVDRLGRSFIEVGGNRPILDRLIAVAYASSLRPLEGRYPNFTIALNFSRNVTELLKNFPFSILDCRFPRRCCTSFGHQSQHIQVMSS